MGINGNILLFPVDDTVGEKKHMHSDGGSYHVFCHIISYHEAILRLYFQLVQNIPVVKWIGFAVFTDIVHSKYRDGTAQLQKVLKYYEETGRKNEEGRRNL